ncbi:hypothetical protein, partial [Pseudomonas sp. MWU12-2115]|uniref:hypothetical protein n=1 Tax=Pseudomonas sp. MWU12-2115 TaxID=2071713 RepID=UPI001C499627
MGAGLLAKRPSPSIKILLYNNFLGLVFITHVPLGQHLVALLRSPGSVSLDQPLPVVGRPFGLLLGDSRLGEVS